MYKRNAGKTGIMDGSLFFSLLVIVMAGNSSKQTEHNLIGYLQKIFSNFQQLDKF